MQKNNEYETECTMILEYLEDRPKFTSEIIEYMETSKIQCHAILQYLTSSNQIEKIGTGDTAIYQLL